MANPVAPLAALNGRLRSLHRKASGPESTMLWLRSRWFVVPSPPVSARPWLLQPVDALQLADRIPGSPGKTASGLRKHDALDDVTQAHVAMFGQGPEHLHAMTRDGMVAAYRREVPATLLPWQNSHPICARRIRPFSCPEKPIRQRPNTCGQIPPATEGKALVHHVRQSRQDHRRHQ